MREGGSERISVGMRLVGVYGGKVVVVPRPGEVVVGGVQCCGEKSGLGTRGLCYR